MSERNGTAATTIEKSKSKTARMTHSEFFLLCEEMRNQRERLMAERPLLNVAAKWLGEKLKCVVSNEQIKEAAKLTGIEWIPNKQGKGVGKRRTDAHARDVVLSLAIVRLYKKLGEELPDNLAALHKHLMGTPE